MIYFTFLLIATSFSHNVLERLVIIRRLRHDINQMYIDMFKMPTRDNPPSKKKNNNNNKKEEEKKKPQTNAHRLRHDWKFWLLSKSICTNAYHQILFRFPLCVAFCCCLVAVLLKYWLLTGFSFYLMHWKCVYIFYFSRYIVIVWLTESRSQPSSVMSKI